MEKCIYKYGREAVSLDEFKETSCQQCQQYLGYNFHHNPDISSNSSQFYSGKNDFHNWLIDKCSDLFHKEDCSRLLKCCSNAVMCCKKQLANYKTFVENKSSCPMVWDGFSCWDPGVSGQISIQSCPDFLLYKSNKFATKTCLENGTWQTLSNGIGWTDFRQCTDVQNNLIPLWMEIFFLLMSICITIPAILLLLSIKRLRHIVRIRLHLLLLFSLTSRSFIRTIWNFKLILPVLYSENTNNVSQSINHIDGCLILRIILLYLDSVCFFCFALEGIYLFRLISNSLQKPKHVLSMTISFLTFPLLSVIIYSVVRYNLNEQNEDGCWIGTSSQLEWIHIIPNLLCVTINIFLLFYVLKVLMNRFRTHQRDVLNIKRTVKAIIVLIPLFGIQIMCTIYRIDNSYLYSIFSSVINDTQAIWSSINLSFFNKEVKMKFNTKRQRIETSIKNRWLDRTYSNRSFSQGSKISVFKKINATFRSHKPDT